MRGSSKWLKLWAFTSSNHWMYCNQVVCSPKKPSGEFDMKLQWKRWRNTTFFIGPSIFCTETSCTSAMVLLNEKRTIDDDIELHTFIASLSAANCTKYDVILFYCFSCWSHLTLHAHTLIYTTYTWWCDVICSPCTCTLITLKLVVDAFK